MLDHDGWVSCANHCPMGRWSAVFSLDCYSWPYGRDANTGEASLPFLCCLSNNLLWCSSSQSCPISLWYKTGMMPRTCLLNINVAGPGKPWPSRVVWICSRAMFMSPPESVHFLNICFTNLIHASTCLCFGGGMPMILLPLHWWFYRTAGICLKQSLCQHLTLYFGVCHIQQIWLLLWWLGWLGFLLIIPPVSWWWETCRCNLQGINSFCC